VCVVAGTVTLRDGGSNHIPPELGGPPGGTPPNGFTFNNVLLACAGSVLGTCPAAASGTTEGLATVSGFAGSWSVSCDVTGQTCAGDIGGPSSGLPPGRWSRTAGPIILGSISSVNCSPIAAGVGGMSNASGVIALAAAPNPLCTTVAGSNTGNPIPPLAGTPTGIAYCGIVVAGVAVLVDTP
jgi:hypothetical protein